MRLPAPGTPAQRAARRRRREQMERDGRIRVEMANKTPDASLLYSPRVMFFVLLVLAVVGILVVKSTDSPEIRAARRPELPHRVALRQLNTLATALGRYRFHVGDFPPQPPGLTALLNNPGAPGWNGPYINVLLRDPWETPYQYEPLSNGLPRLFTRGPDGVADTPDDLRPDPKAFDPGTDWTTGWVRASERLPGIRILPRAPELHEP